MSKEKKQLVLQEKVALFILAIFCITLAVVRKKQSDSYPKVEFPDISVYVCGAVIEEKTLKLPYGSKVQDALCRVSLEKDALLERLNFDQKLQNEQILIVPKDKKYFVYVRGCIENSKLLVFEEEPTIEEISLQIGFLPESNVQRFKRRKKKILNCEILEVFKSKKKVLTP